MTTLNIEGKRVKVSDDFLKLSPEQQAATVEEIAQSMNIGAQAQAPKPDRNPDGTYGQPPEGMFANPTTGQMTNRDMLRENQSTSRGEALGVGYMQGFALNRADEMMGLAGRLEGGPEMQNFRREQFRANEEANREDFGGSALAGDIAGAVTSPVMRVLGPVKTAWGAAAQGAGLGFAYGSGAAEDGERLEQGALGAIIGGVTGGTVKKAIDIGTPGFQRLFNKSVERPTVENLRAAKTAAYKAVDDAGEVFDATEMRGLFNTVKTAINDSGSYVAGVDKQTGAVLNLLQSNSNKPATIGQLDKLRQGLWSRYNASNGGEPLILEAIEAIDDMIVNRGSTSELMSAARLAHSRFKKVELLENAFIKAQDQTASTGSGGNILNKYRQAVTSIINNPKQAKWFEPEEIETMRNFVRGSFIENQLRRLGKLSPSGNGLMMALNLGAAAYNPAMLAGTAAGALAKEGADSMGERGANAILGMAAGQAPRVAASVPGAVGGAAGFAGGNAEEISRYLGGL
jgi:hypothetical protein